MIQLESKWKRISILLISLLIIAATVHGVVGSSNSFQALTYKDNQSEEMGGTRTSNQGSGFVLDQSQIDTNNHRYTATGWYLVQSFTPSMNPLTKIDILLELRGQGSENEILELSIKESLNTTASPLATSTISYTWIREGKVWIEFFFDNVSLTPEQTYYIYLSQQGYGDCYWYGIYDDDYYERGFAYGYYKDIAQWQNLSDPAIFPDFDFCFKTYSLGENDPPMITSIEGPSRGRLIDFHEFSITAVDADDDPVYLYVDWGDESTAEWTGPYQSDDTIQVSHKWNERGTYTISVQGKDELGNRGEWYTYEVKMAYAKSFSFFEQMFSNHPIIEWIHQLIVGS